MKTAKKLVLLAAALPITLATASAYAYGGKGNNQDFSGKCGGSERGIMRQLDLTEEQKDQFRDMKEAKRDRKQAERSEQMGAKRAQMQAQQTEVQALVLAKDFDQAKAETLAKTMADMQAERRVEMLKDRHEMMSILTDAQKEKLKTLQAENMAECADKMGDKMGKGKGKGGKRG